MELQSGMKIAAQVGFLGTIHSYTHMERVNPLMPISTDL